MANSNIQSYPELPANARQLQDDDVLLVLRNGFPYRYRVSPASGTDTLDLVVAAAPDTISGIPNQMQSEFTLPDDARTAYAWLEIRATALTDSLPEAYIIPLTDVFASSIIQLRRRTNEAPAVSNEIFISRGGNIIRLVNCEAPAVARLRRPSATL